MGSRERWWPRRSGLSTSLDKGAAEEGGRGNVLVVAEESRRERRRHAAKEGARTAYELRDEQPATQTGSGLPLCDTAAN